MRSLNKGMTYLLNCIVVKKKMATYSLPYDQVMNADRSMLIVTDFPVRLRNKLFMCAENAGPEKLSPFLFYKVQVKRKHS